MALFREWLPTNIFRSRSSTETNANVEKAANQFRDRFDGKDASVASRKENATTLVNEYYDLVTDFYEYGWGQAFHFAPRYAGESFYEALARHEYFLALHGNFTAGQRLLDIGCGVGGPLRNIVRFTGAHVTGINNNEYQIGRGRSYDSKMGLSHLTNYVKTDFCNMPFKDNEYDGAYAIEATCHATDKVKCYSEIFRVIKPGTCFVGYEWVVTDKYDHSNEHHRKVRHGIELGDALPTLETAAQVVAALEASGFIVELSFDVIPKFEDGPAKTITWYNPLEGSYTSIGGWKATPIGRLCTSTMVTVLEKLKLAPAGSKATAAILEEAAVNLVEGGKLGIFTPCLFFKARKPATGASTTKQRKGESQ
jgi:sterol 24-C-methyltransferase